MASLVQRTLQRFGYTRSEQSAATKPPARPSANQNVTPSSAMTLSTVYRGISIHATAACQLPIIVERGEQEIPTPSIVAKPSLRMSRSAFIEYTITSLYLTGDAFWLPTRADSTARRPGEVVDLTPINPDEVGVHLDQPADPFGNDVITYSYRGRTLTADRDIIHLQLLRIPGRHRGLGPIQAARIEIAGALDARDYGAMWFSDTEIPDGVLTTDQELKPGDSDVYKNVWYGRNPDGTEKETAATRNQREKLRVLGKGLKYAPLMLKPADLQFLESQQFSTTQIARLLGTPASLMLAAVEGDSRSYSNIEQDWIGYTRFGLMLALREMEEAMTGILARGNTARFKIEALLRSDTKTRYEGYAIALDPDTGWMDADEVRRIEGKAPFTQAQRDARASRQPSTPEQLLARSARRQALESTNA